MGQKIHPTGFRMGITLPWSSRWAASKKDFPRMIQEDATIRRFIGREYDYAGIAKIDIERSGEETTVIIATARPGLLVGRKGKKLDEMTEGLNKRLGDTGTRLKITITEVSRPELDANIVAQNIREQLEKRMPFRRVLKKTMALSITAGARGIKVRLAGGLGGAEMARVQNSTLGRVPLTTLDADIDYCFTEACTTYGQIGVKVWINRGTFKHRQPKSAASRA